MEELEIYIGGEVYRVNSNGDMKAADSTKSYSGNWVFIGVSTHHWHRRPTISFIDIWENPKLAIGGYLWDVDHGTVRCWGGSYNGRIPKIESIRKVKH